MNPEKRRGVVLFLRIVDSEALGDFISFQLTGQKKLLKCCYRRLKGNVFDMKGKVKDTCFKKENKKACSTVLQVLTEVFVRNSVAPGMELGLKNLTCTGRLRVKFVAAN